MSLLRRIVHWLGGLLALADVLRDTCALWWRAVTEPPWVRSVAQDLAAEEPEPFHLREEPWW